MRKHIILIIRTIFPILFLFAIIGSSNCTLTKVVGSKGINCFPQTYGTKNITCQITFQSSEIINDWNDLLFTLEGGLGIGWIKKPTCYTKASGSWEKIECVVEGGASPLLGTSIRVHTLTGATMTNILANTPIYIIINTLSTPMYPTGGGGTVGLGITCLDGTHKVDDNPYYSILSLSTTPSKHRIYTVVRISSCSITTTPSPPAIETRIGKLLRFTITCDIKESPIERDSIIQIRVPNIFNLQTVNVEGSYSMTLATGGVMADQSLTIIDCPTLGDPQCVIKEQLTTTGILSSGGVFTFIYGKFDNLLIPIIEETAFIVEIISPDGIVIGYTEIKYWDPPYLDTKSIDFTQTKIHVDSKYINEVPINMNISLTMGFAYPQYTIIELYCSSCTFLPWTAWTSAPISSISVTETPIFHNNAFTGTYTGFPPDTGVSNSKLVGGNHWDYLVLERFDAMNIGDVVHIGVMLTPKDISTDAMLRVRIYYPGVTYIQYPQYMRGLMYEEYEGIIVPTTVGTEIPLLQTILQGSDPLLPQFFFQKGSTTGLYIYIYDTVALPNQIWTPKLTAPGGFIINIIATDYEYMKGAPACNAFPFPPTSTPTSIEGLTPSEPFPTGICILTMTLEDITTNTLNNKYELMLTIDNYYSTFLLIQTPTTPFTIGGDLIITDLCREADTYSTLTFAFTTPVGVSGGLARFVLYFPGYDVSSSLIFLDEYLNIPEGNTVISGSIFPCIITHPYGGAYSPVCRIMIGGRAVPPHRFMSATHIYIDPVYTGFTLGDVISLTITVKNGAGPYTHYIIGGIEKVDGLGISSPYKYMEYKRDIISTIAGEIIPGVDQQSTLPILSSVFNAGSLSMTVAVTTDTPATPQPNSQAYMVIILPWLIYDNITAITCTIGGNPETMTIYTNQPMYTYTTIIFDDITDNPILSTGTDILCLNIIAPHSPTLLGGRELDLLLIESTTFGVVRRGTPFVYFNSNTWLTADTSGNYLDIQSVTTTPNNGLMVSILTIRLRVRTYLGQELDRELEIALPFTLDYPAKVTKCGVTGTAVVDVLKNTCEIVDTTHIRIHKFTEYETGGGPINVNILGFLNPATGNYGPFILETYESTFFDERSLLYIDTTGNVLAIVNPSLVVGDLDINSATLLFTAASAFTDLTITVQNSLKLPIETEIFLTFPPEFDIITYREYIKIDGSGIIIKNTNIPITGIIAITVGEEVAASTTFTLIFSHIRNPTTTGATSSFPSLEAKYSTQQICNIGTTQTLTITGSTAIIYISSNIYPLNAGVRGTYTFIMSISNAVAVSDIIYIEFPGEYTDAMYISGISKVSCANIYSSFPGVTLTYTCSLSNRRIGVVPSERIPPDTEIGIIISGLMNPVSAGALGVFGVLGCRVGVPACMYAGQFDTNTIITTSPKQLRVTASYIIDLENTLYVPNFVLILGTLLVAPVELVIKLPPPVILASNPYFSIYLNSTLIKCTSVTGSFSRVLPDTDILIITELSSDCNAPSTVLMVEIYGIINPPNPNTIEDLIEIYTQESERNRYITYAYPGIDLSRLTIPPIVVSNIETYTLTQNSLPTIQVISGRESDNITITLNTMTPPDTIIILEGTPTSNIFTLLPPNIEIYSTALSTNFQIYSTPNALIGDCFNIIWRLILPTNALNSYQHQVPLDTNFCVIGNKTKIYVNVTTSDIIYAGMSVDVLFTLNQSASVDILIDIISSSTDLQFTTGNINKLMITKGEYIYTYKIWLIPICSAGAYTMSFTIPLTLSNAYEFASTGTDSHTLNVNSLGPSATPNIYNIAEIELSRNYAELQIFTNVYKPIFYYQINILGLNQYLDITHLISLMNNSIPMNTQIRFGNWSFGDCLALGKTEGLVNNPRIIFDGLFGHRVYELFIYLYDGVSDAYSQVFRYEIKTLSISEPVLLGLTMTPNFPTTQREIGLLEASIANLLSITPEYMNTTISNTEDEGTIMIHPSPILNLTKEQLTEEITNLTTTEMNSNLQIFSLNTYNITNHNIKYYDDKGGEITSITFNSSYLHINVSLKSNREGYIVGIAQAQLLEDPNSFQVFLRLNSSSLPAISSWKCYLEYGKEDEVYNAF